MLLLCVCMLKERLILISESINNITHAQIALYNTSFCFYLGAPLDGSDLIKGREKLLLIQSAPRSCHERHDQVSPDRRVI